jgi:hypothetical protein
MCNHLNLQVLIHIFTITYLIMIIIIMRGENFVASAEHRLRITDLIYSAFTDKPESVTYRLPARTAAT